MQKYDFYAEKTMTDFVLKSSENYQGVLVQSLEFSVQNPPE